MEALPPAPIAALTIYDMCKSVDRGMTIGEIALWEKTGWPLRRVPAAPAATTTTSISDRSRARQASTRAVAASANGAQGRERAVRRVSASPKPGDTAGYIPM